MVDLDPARGAEADRRRPAVIVSNNAANRTAETLGRGVLTVVPVTSNVDRVYRFQVRLPPLAGGLSRESKAQVDRFVPSLSSGSASGWVPFPRSSWPRLTRRCACSLRSDAPPTQESARLRQG
jgi:mRNA interferase MazF